MGFWRQQSKCRATQDQSVTQHTRLAAPVQSEKRETALCPWIDPLTTLCGTVLRRGEADPRVSVQHGWPSEGLETVETAISERRVMEVHCPRGLGELLERVGLVSAAVAWGNMDGASSFL